MDITGSGEAAFQEPFYILLNLAIGGTLPGHTIDDTAFPVQYLIDYVRVYGNLTTTTMEPTTTAQTTTVQTTSTIASTSTAATTPSTSTTPVQTTTTVASTTTGPCTVSPASADCTSRSKLIGISMPGNTTILTNTLTQHYNSWDSATKSGFNSYFNMVRKAIWDNAKFPETKAKITEIVTDLKKFNFNNAEKQKVLMDIIISEWNCATIKQFCDCGDE
ncbi:hypothetical protein Ddc_12185 [Ditylenchus destructor]|nr:hypothetical protein Ddc_12185 [Ditylenchus destructor]